MVAKEDQLNHVPKNVILLVSSAAVALTAYGSLGGKTATLSTILLVLICSYLFLLLLGTAILSEKNKFWEKFWYALLPSRGVGFLMFLLLLFATVVGWADIYFEWGGEFDKQISSTADAVYYSFLTLATVGDSRFSPGSEYTRLLVALQVGCSILIFLSVFPLLISRFAMFD